MASSLREKFDKKKMTKKKHLARRINEVARQVAEMDKWCRACGSQFDPKVPGALDTWHVTVGPDGSFLTCPSCHTKREPISSSTPET